MKIVDKLEYNYENYNDMIYNIRIIFLMIVIVSIFDCFMFQECYMDVGSN